MVREPAGYGYAAIHTFALGKRECGFNLVGEHHWENEVFFLPSVNSLS